MTQTKAPVAASPTTSIETVDPETAQVWLGKNSKNRSLRRRLVSTYARDMKSGRWQFTGDAVKFAAGGHLLDGQHRLHALVEADVSLPLLIVRDLPADTQAVMDTGAKRTAADALTLDGEHNSTTLAAIALMIANGGGMTRSSVSTSEILALVESDPSIRWAAETINSFRIPSMTSSVLGYTYWRLSSVDAVAAHAFFDALSSLVGLPAGSPILALHRRLSGGLDRRSRSHAYRQETVACVFMAWNAWRKGESRSIIKLAYSASGRLAIPEPK